MVNLLGKVIAGRSKRLSARKNPIYEIHFSDLPSVGFGKWLKT